MTEPEIAALGPAFAAYLRRFRRCFRQDRTAAHFDTYCRGLLSDLPRKSVEPIALEAGTAKEGAQPQRDPAKRVRHEVFRIAANAPEKRAQVSRCSVSCFRPDAVSE